MAQRYCGMCEKVVSKKECPLCGADTEPLPKGVLPSDLSLDERHANARHHPPNHATRKALREATLKVGR